MHQAFASFRPIGAISRAALATAMLVGLTAACDDSDSPAQEAPGVAESMDSSATTPTGNTDSPEPATDAPEPATGGPASADVVTRIVGDWPTPEDFILCSARVEVTGAIEGVWESEAIAGSDVLGFTTIYAALSEDGSQRAEAQAAEGYDDTGTLIYSIAFVDSEQGVTYSGQADEATFDRRATNLEGITIEGLELPSNEADGTSVTANIIFRC